ncbi:MAG TPA: Rrf2 family transcriptional regulator, partial [Flavobacteriia bacterium]|nr:Rrf2 family transcriptional regulator [Flavobacteriia bacterium]
MLTNASKYAIRSVLFLALNSSMDKKYGAKNIAEELDVPMHFIAKLLQPLVKKGIISSLKGPNGGFYFTNENGKFKICDIIEVIEDRKIFDSCFLGLQKCNDITPCPV